MTRDELRAFLQGRTNHDLVDAEIFRSFPWIFKSQEEYEKWLESIAKETALNRDSIRIVGSAATGFSLSPLKPGRPFRKDAAPGKPPSDIDVALLDGELFDLAWEAILRLDRKGRLHGTDDSRSRIRTEVYWGLVGFQNVPSNTDVARRILGVTSALGRQAPLRGYPVKCRIYRRLEDLHAYHVSSLKRLRTELSKSEP